MWCEHFGIGIVEMMAAGVITIAHKSGGPKTDIISVPGENGFLAATAEEYAEVLHTIFQRRNDRQFCGAIQETARLSVQRFSDEAFEDAFSKAVAPLFSSLL
jgi:alpha-1,2-mannosyltransferase